MFLSLLLHRCNVHKTFVQLTNENHCTFPLMAEVTLLCHLQGNAMVAAEEEADRLKEVEETKKRAEEERREKARLRHKHAFHKELIKQVCYVINQV